MMPTNKQRAKRGAVAVKAYRGVCPDGPLNEDSLLGDLVADVLHYTKSKGFDPDLIIRLGKAHFEAEIC
jgi:hypothetical protein